MFWCMVTCCAAHTLFHLKSKAPRFRFISVCAACLQVLVDPEAAARNKLHKQERRAAGRKRKMEDIQRRRGAGVAVKNKKRQKNADI